MIDSVIFDMDGLMFDTERVWATLWEPALATLGLSYKEGLDAAARGSAGDSMRAVLRRFYGPDCDTDAIMDALHAQAETAFQAPPPKKPGLDELIAYLEAQHIPMVVASSSRMASILRHLNNWHMTDHFQALISGEQFSASKPDPEIFLTAPAEQPNVDIQFEVSQRRLPMEGAWEVVVRGTITVTVNEDVDYNGKKYPIASLPENLMEIIEAGGLVKAMRRRNGLD